jgi:tetratricopeptide (TPR) repeat protein
MEYKARPVPSLVFSVIACLCAACAVPKDQAAFSIRSRGDGDGREFFSSRELMVAGLVSESLELGSKGRVFDAESRLRRAHMAAPDNQAVTFNLAVVLGQQGYSEEALDLLRDLRAKQGDLPRFMIASADVYAMQGDFEKARDNLKVAFDAYQKANNYAQAAVMARSISNLAFASGHEQEALCYSYEALSLAPAPAQLGFHASIMVALNLYQAASGFITEQIALDPARGAGSQVHFAHSLALGAMGKREESIKEAEVALDLLGDNPDIVPEVNALWWLVKKDAPPAQDLDPKVVEAEAQMKETFFSDVLRLQQRPTYSLVRWPAYFRDKLDAVKEAPQRRWWESFSR